MEEADRNNDEYIMPSEIGKTMQRKGRNMLKGQLFFMAFSSPEMQLSKCRAEVLAKGHQSSFPLIIGEETNSRADSLLGEADEKTRQWYRDFIVTMKLGQLMSPPGHCASDLYDSLATIPALSPLHRNWQRKLAAALLDETQQALNAYLKTDSRELFRRWKYVDSYNRYPQYMERAIALMGTKSFMLQLMQTKLHYFRGLEYRLDGEKKGNREALLSALAAQEKALSYEPHAAFVLNEMGLLSYLLGREDDAGYFLQAAELAPSWSIPQLNLSIHYQQENKLDLAMFHALECVRLNPESVIAVDNLGVIQLKSGNYQSAERYFRQAISIDIKYEIPYYNLSCTKSLQGQLKASLLWLEKALEQGFADWQLIDNDPDLANLRTSANYIQWKRDYVGRGE